MFTVTPIGSCRITAPLRYGHANYGIQLNLDRCYGYCHSPAEAVQMARFMQGQSKFDGQVWPLVSRSHQLDAISAVDHQPSDLYVIELASAKEVTLDRVSVQLNYLNSVYSAFFADAGRAQAFWGCAEQGDENTMFAFLEKEWSDTKLQRVQAATLGRIRLRYVTRESLRHNIRELTELLPDVVFVSHVDACKPDGEKIRSRSEFIRMVCEETRQAGCKFYNPTDLMEEFGQTAAIEDESTGLAHFTTAFSDAVMDEWMRRYIAPKTDDAVRGAVDGALKLDLLPQVAADLQGGRLADAKARLLALSQDAEDVEPLLHEADEISQSAQEVFKEKTTDRAGENLTADERNQLVLEAGAHGVFDVALDLAAGAPGGLKSLPAYVLLRVGDQALVAKDTDNAFEFFLAATCQKQGLDRAKSSLASLAIDEDIDLLAELNPETATRFLSHLEPVQRLGLLRLNGSDFTAAVTASSEGHDVAEIITHLAEDQGIEVAAEVLAHWRGLNDADRITDAVVIDVLDRWLAAALKIADPINRTQALNWVLHGAPRFQTARDAMRDIRTDLALRIRAAGKDGDIDALDAMQAEVDALNAGLPEFDLWRARLRFGLGQFDKALVLGQSAAAMLPEKINIWVLLMRAADKSDDAIKAVEFARKVIALACADTEKLKTEAESVLQSHMAEA